MSSLSIPRAEFTTRQERAQAAAAERGLDGLLVVGRSFYDRPGHLAYLTNHFPPFPASPFTVGSRGLGHGLLLLPVHGTPVLVVDGRAYRRDLVVVEDVRTGNDLVRALIDVLHEQGLGRARLGLVGQDLFPVGMAWPLAAALPDLHLEPADDIVDTLRVLKSSAEIALLRQAARVAGLGLAAARQVIREGAREWDICAAGTGAALAAGADFVRYLRVHSGPWAGVGSRWPPATNRVVGLGDMITLDIIGAVNGYQFDVLRATTVGEPTAEQRKVLDTGLRATERTVALVRPGVSVRELVRIAWQTLDEAGYGAYASGFIGHGIGLETVEPPYLQAGVEEVLRPGMVVCVEPSIRIPSWGGCSIEQEVVVTEDGYELLTTFPAQWW